MKDFAGNELEVGQQVICLTAGRSTSWMSWATVVGFTPKKVRLEIKRSWGIDQTLRDPDNVVVPMNPDITAFLQSSGLVGRSLTP